MEAKGAEVRVLSADVAVRAELEGALAEVREESAPARRGARRRADRRRRADPRHRRARPPAAHRAQAARRVPPARRDEGAAPRFLGPLLVRLGAARPPGPRALRRCQRVLDAVSGARIDRGLRPRQHPVGAVLGGGPRRTGRRRRAHGSRRPGLSQHDARARVRGVGRLLARPRAEVSHDGALSGALVRKMSDAARSGAPFWSELARRGSRGCARRLPGRPCRLQRFRQVFAAAAPDKRARC